MKGMRDHKLAIIEHLKNDERFRKAYLNEALNEDEPKVVISMLRDVWKRQGDLRSWQRRRD